MSPRSSKKARGLLYHLYTVWLFAVEPVFDALLPCCVFIFCAVVSGPVLDLPSQKIEQVALRIFRVIIWMYLLLLQFSLHNQRHPLSITEDSINKPWRPLPSRRITVRQTNKLLLVLYIVLVLVNIYLRITPLFVIYTVIVLVYNDFGGGETALRNIYNAAGFACFLSGGLHITLGRGFGNPIPHDAYRWVALMTGILVTTFHAQEFRDARGDNAIGRRTLLTLVGATPARVLLVMAIAFWSFFVPRWLHTAWLVTAGPYLLGAAVSALAMLGAGKMDTRLDRRMYKSWALWVISLSVLPWLKRVL